MGATISQAQSPKLPPWLALTAPFPLLLSFGSLSGSFEPEIPIAAPLGLAAESGRPLLT